MTSARTPTSFARGTRSYTFLCFPQHAHTYSQIYCIWKTFVRNEHQVIGFRSTSSMGIYPLLPDLSAAPTSATRTY